MNVSHLDKNLNKRPETERNNYHFRLVQISTEDSSTVLNTLSGLFTNACAKTQMTKGKTNEP